jgi:4-amino-4-deoxy-L-arabinose transferase-like glycosyltransferase
MERAEKKSGRVVLTLFVVSLIVRFLFAAFILGMDAMPVDDAVTYDNIGINLVREHQYIQDTSDVVYYSLRPPLLPLMLGGAYALSGHSYVASRILMIILGSLIPPVIYALTRRIFGRRAAVVAGWIAVFYPFFVLYSTILLAEVPAVLFVSLMTLFLLRFIQEGKTLDICLAGAAAGLASLCRPTVLVLVPVAVLWLLLVIPRRPRPILKACGLFLLLFALVLAPWTYRNFRVFGEFVPVTSMGGLTLWYGNNPAATGNLGDDYLRLKEIRPNPGTTRETEISRYFRGLAVDYMKSHPKRTAVLAVKKAVHFWRPSGFRIPGMIDETPSWLRFAVGFLSYVPLLLLFIFEVLASIRSRAIIRNPGVILMVLSIIVFTIVHSIFPSLPRYRMPIEPFIIAMAAAGAVRVAAFFGK